ncbi:MAG: phosphomannomutase/phosphoglucomutase, partial [Planctomycetota bacterium]
ETEDKEAAIDDLMRAYPNAEIEELDGVTVDCGEWWCNVRMSNTEPLLRLNLEGSSDALVDEKIAEVAVHLGERVEH